MQFRRDARAIVAVAAAYAVALQGLLLAIGPPFGADELGARQLCSSSGATPSGQAPPGHSPGCCDACLTCCCGVAAAVAPGTSGGYVLGGAHKLAPAVELVPVPQPGVAGAHRPRAPPLA